MVPQLVGVPIVIAVPSIERMPLMLALVKVFAPEPESVTLLKVYVNGAIDCAPAALKLTVPVPQVNVPLVPRIKLSPAYRVPASENMIWEATPADVIFPEAATVPVEIVISEVRRFPVAPPSVIVVQDKLPSFTANVLPVVLAVGGRDIVKPPVNATATPGLSETVVFEAVVVKDKVAALTSPVIVAVLGVVVAFVTLIGPVVVKPAMLCVACVLVIIITASPQSIGPPLLTKLPLKVKLAVPCLEKLPFTVVVPAGNVFARVPERFRL